jgi:flagellar motor switch protein FliG
MAERPLSGPEKSAILFLTLGEDVSAPVLQYLSDQEIQRIGNYMAHMREVEEEKVDNVLEEFYSMATGVTGFTAGGKEYVKKLLMKALDPEKASWIMNNLAVPTLETGLEALKWLDPHTIAHFLQGEHPQTIAVILAHLDSQQAGAILGLLPEHLQLQASLRIAKIERIPPGVIQELDQVLQSELKATGALETDKVGGVQTVAEMLNVLDQSTERALMSKIEEVDANMAEEIRKLMFVFEDLAHIDDRAMQTILREVAMNELPLALKTASETLRSKIFKNISQRAAETLRDELEVMGPVRISDVEKIQQKILKLAKRLETEGKIILGGRGKDSLV